MPLPSNPAAWAPPMDPADLLDYKAEFGDWLGEGQAIATFEVALMPEAALLGVSVKDGEGRQPMLADDDTSIVIWLEVDDARRDDAAFSGAGATIGVVFTIVTTTSPSRRRQRTFTVRIAQQ